MLLAVVQCIEKLMEQSREKSQTKKLERKSNSCFYRFGRRTTCIIGTIDIQKISMEVDSTVDLTSDLTLTKSTQNSKANTTV